MGSERSELLAAALRYAALGLPVFPVHGIVNEQCTCNDPACTGNNRGKHPMTAHGLKDASTDQSVICRWWGKSPSANVGIAVGGQILVLDVDSGKGGPETLDDLEEEHGRLPDTPLVLTGGGGRHYYLMVPEAYRGKLRNVVRLFPGIDIRADGGYVVAPPSLHVSGTRYEWEASSMIGEVGYGAAPEWLLRAIQGPKKAPTAPEAGNDTLRDPDAILDGVEEGGRDDALFRYACRLRRDNLTRKAAEALVLKAASECTPPFPEAEAKRKVAQAWTYPTEQAKVLAGEIVERPQIEWQAGNVRATWINLHIQAIARGIKEHSDGRVTGFLSITTTVSGAPKKLHAATFNFTSTRTRNEWTKTLAERAGIADWFELLEQLCDEVTRLIQEGEPVESIDTGDPSVEAPRFVLRPILLHRQPVIIFGDRGSTKSYMGQLFAYLLALGQLGRLLMFDPDVPIQRPLYLDWEDCSDTIRWRFRCLSVGTGLPSARISYRRCSRPLYMDVEQVRKIVLEGGYDFVIIDSLGPACGGDLNAPQPAMDFFGALRSLNVSSLILAHTAKGKKGGSDRSVFGSVFFENEARSIWQINSQSEIGIVSVGLTQTKMNNGPFEDPIGLQFVFEPGSTSVVAASVEDNAAAAGTMPIRDRIIAMLQDVGRGTTQKIADELQQAPATVRATLSRMKKEGLVEKTSGGIWVAVEDPDGEELAPF